jgi:glycosyltransferase involved in cell wall biosynthesis
LLFPCYLHIVNPSTNPLLVFEKIEASKIQYTEWVKELGFQPKMLMMYVGRWSKEKRIHLLFDAVPEGCALVICGDGNNDYAEQIAKDGAALKHVLPCRKMLNGHEIRVAYTACDLFVSASDFETLGNTVVEALCSGTACGVQPAQGHLEHVVDGKNSFFVDFNDSVKAKAVLSRVAEQLGEGIPILDILPDLESTSVALRTGNFAKNFDREVISVANSEMTRRLNHHRAVLVFFQVLYMLAAVLTLCVMRPIMRLAYMCIQYPRFEMLPGLGNAVEMKNKKALTFSHGVVKRIDSETEKSKVQ